MKSYLLYKEDDVVIIQLNEFNVICKQLPYTKTTKCNVKSIGYWHFSRENVFYPLVTSSDHIDFFDAYEDHITSLVMRKIT